jgi:hypothetical protein
MIVTPLNGDVPLPLLMMDVMLLTVEMRPDVNRSSPSRIVMCLQEDE